MNKVETQNSTSNSIIEYIYFYNCGQIKFVEFHKDGILIPQNFNV